MPRIGEIITRRHPPNRHLGVFSPRTRVAIPQDASQRDSRGQHIEASQCDYGSSDRLGGGPLKLTDKIRRRVGWRIGFLGGSRDKTWLDATTHEVCRPRREGGPYVAAHIYVI